MKKKTLGKKVLSKFVLLGLSSVALVGTSSQVFAGSSNNQCNAMDQDAADQSCKGKNSCKGMGNCKTDKHACKGQNMCKGQGGGKCSSMTKDSLAAQANKMADKRANIL